MCGTNKGACARMKEPLGNQ